jgi:hypothetical protein
MRTDSSSESAHTSCFLDEKVSEENIHAQVTEEDIHTQVSNVYVNTITTNQAEPMIHQNESLEQLFLTISDEMPDAHLLCKLIKPFAVLALQRNPTSILLIQILAFLDQRVYVGNNISSDSDNASSNSDIFCSDSDNVSSSSENVNWSCTNGQMNAIILHLNSNQYLLREECESANQIVTNDMPITSHSHQTLSDIDTDEAFLRELAELAM